MQAEGIQVSPYSVRKALENTCSPIGCLPEDKLSNGQGLIQIDKLDYGLYIELLDKLFDCIGIYVVCVFPHKYFSCRAFEYAQKSADLPCVWHKITISQAGKTSRFIFYLNLFIHFIIIRVY